MLKEFWIIFMRGSRKFYQRGSKFDNVFFFFFFVVEWRKDQNTTISGPSSARQGKAIELAFLWRADDGPTLNAGLAALWFWRGSGPVLLKKPYIFVICQGGVRTPCPHLWIRPWCWSYGCTSRLTNLAALCCTCSRLWISLLWRGFETMYEYSRLGRAKVSPPPGGLCSLDLWK